VSDASGRLAPAEVDDLLRRPILARIGLIGTDGWPKVVPVWIDWDGTALLIIARARSRFVADLRREPRVCVSIVADDDPDRRLQVFGRAAFDQDPGPLSGALLATARRMALRYEGAPGVEYIERSRGWDRVPIRIVPERIVSWGSPDWHPRYGAGASTSEAGTTEPGMQEEPR
jgi:PPOX class probable F420-dependent enzyme